jgi:signal transduction histidine kinase
MERRLGDVCHPLRLWRSRLTQGFMQKIDNPKMRPGVDSKIDEARENIGAPGPGITAELRQEPEQTKRHRAAFRRARQFAEAIFSGEASHEQDVRFSEEQGVRKTRLARNDEVASRLRPLGKMENQHIEKLVNATRPVAVLLALLALKEMAPGPAGRDAAFFLYGYLILSVAILLVFSLIRPPLGPFARDSKFSFPPEIDLIGLAVFIALTPSLASFWFFYLFAVFAMATRARQKGISAYWSRPGNLFMSDAGLVSGGGAIASVIRTVWLAPTITGMLQWVGIAAATYLAGVCVAWLGMRERAFVGENGFIEQVLGTVRVEKGLAESVRLVLSELAREFDCECAVLVICDEEVERLFTWKGDQDRRHAMPPEVLPLTKSGAYLAEDFSQTVCWNALEGRSQGFGWDRENGAAAKLETPQASVREELGARSVMAATMFMAGHPSGRVLLVNGRHRFTRRDLRWFERIVRQMNVPLENVFQLRHLRTRAVEAERSRISRDLHDGILQTLLSLNIQLGVLERKTPQAPEAAAQDIEALRKTVRQEGEDLRQMVKDLRPLRVESADLREMMYGFAERYHNESGLVVDLFLEENDLRAPDRICREVFQIYRESLNNIKKHAHASHVVVKLWQDDTKVFLVVDDNGQGFSFSGRFGSEELDRLRLGPISIKERTRTVGGVLTVESNPGHGARLTIEIPVI